MTIVFFSAPFLLPTLLRPSIPSLANYKQSSMEEGRGRRRKQDWRDHYRVFCAPFPLTLLRPSIISVENCKHSSMEENIMVRRRKEEEGRWKMKQDSRDDYPVCFSAPFLLPTLLRPSIISVANCNHSSMRENIVVEEEGGRRRRKEEESGWEMSMSPCALQQDSRSPSFLS